MSNGEKRKRMIKMHFSQNQSTLRLKTLHKSLATHILSYIDKGYVIRLKNKHFIRQFMLQITPKRLTLFHAAQM